MPRREGPGAFRGRFPLSVYPFFFFFFCDPCATSGPRPVLRSFSGFQEGPRTGPKMRLRMDSQGIEKGAPKGPERVLSKRISKDCFRKSCATLHRFVSYQLVSYRIASHRIASHRVASHRIVSRRIILNRIARQRIASQLIPSYRITSHRVLSYRGAS